MPKKKKWKSGRSNLLKIGGVFLLATVAILAVQFGNFGPKFILPEEHAQLAERRISPDNAFHILIEAGRLLPQKKPYVLRVPDDANPGGPMRYEAEPDSVGRLLRIARPEDDPDLIDYVHSSEPALEKACEALDKPFFAYQETSPYRRNNSVQLCTALPPHLMAQARIATFVENRPEEAPGHLINALRITRLLVQDEQYASGIENLGLQQIRLFARGTSDPALLIQVQQPLKEIGIPFPDPVQLLKLDWRRIDQLQSGHHLRDRGSLFSRIELWRIRRLAQEVIDNKGRYEQLATGSLTALARWTQDNPDELDDDMLYYITRAVETNASYLATNLVLAIELYQADEGTYPKELTQLAPPTSPKSPATPSRTAPSSIVAPTRVMSFTALVTMVRTITHHRRLTPSTSLRSDTS